jgi:hypothetical protein
MLDEPYDRIGHVRICGGDGYRKGRFYPETMTFAGPQTTAKSLINLVSGNYYQVKVRQRQVNATLYLPNHMPPIRVKLL